MSPCKGLPEDLWKLILQFVPVVDRLRVCTTVSTTLYRAAVAATYQLQIILGSVSSERTERFWQWLDLHGQHVAHLMASSKHTVSVARRPVLSRLPCQNLRQLELSKCRVQLAPSSSHPGVLHVCATLTHLKLYQCRLVGGWTSLTALSALPALQHLQLNDLWHDESEIRQDRPPYDLPAAVLSCLQQLTSLELWGAGVCIQHISCLRRLQQLSLGSTATLTPSTMPGLDQLTALQDLSLMSSTLDPTALHTCTTLRRLSLCFTKITGGTEGMQSLLALIAGQQQLQQLVLHEHGYDWPSAPSVYTALTASSKLQQLHLHSCNLPAGAWQQGVFRPGQQLPELQSFISYPGYHTPAVFSQQDVGALVSCCPALRTIDILIQPGVQLTGLAQLTALSHLHIREADARSYRSLSALSNLGRLCTLTIDGDTLHTTSLLPLTSLRGLTFLSAPGIKVVRLYNQGSAATSDVWQQLLQYCQAQQQQQQEQQQQYCSAGGYNSY